MLFFPGIDFGQLRYCAVIIIIIVIIIFFGNVSMIIRGHNREILEKYSDFDAHYNGRPNPIMEPRPQTRETQSSHRHKLRRSPLNPLLRL